jgi:hypothetical protein
MYMSPALPNIVNANILHRHRFIHRQPGYSAQHLTRQLGEIGPAFFLLSCKLVLVTTVSQASLFQKVGLDPLV